ncbi:uncharacterized protein K444DRAFT_400025 [Hyaloscypha bicolor E]|uniref:Uncharacterized protein n=1 Tax=Hyaloscypha bicolor E TaxID=1095630 RepID=A0A2J6TB78_9HELO|nr:uncharacterized protein K444DRAFT_400025 [Hyaloscypha bicolor E]PMD60271.1 hypothetical protein K444DRAFT_400025 [Hyaloscypha bicolor E]
MKVQQWIFFIWLRRRRRKNEHGRVRFPGRSQQAFKGRVTGPGDPGCRVARLWRSRYGSRSQFAYSSRSRWGSRSQFAYLSRSRWGSRSQPLCTYLFSQLLGVPVPSPPQLCQLQVMHGNCWKQ